MSMYGFLFFLKNLNLITFNYYSLLYFFDYIIVTLHLLNSFSFLLIEVTESFSLLMLCFFIVLVSFNLLTTTFAQNNILKTTNTTKKTTFGNFYSNYFNYSNSHFLIRF